jgi:phosphoserine phosphatase
MYLRRITLGLALSVATFGQFKAQLHGQWDQFNQQKIEALLQNYGNKSPNYQAEKPPYAVFDWDNTSAFLDVQEATLAYQLTQLQFKMSAKQLAKALATGIDTQKILSPKNQAQKSLTAQQLIDDIGQSYRWLTQHYVGFGQGGAQNLASIQQTPHYLNFIAKMRFMYEAIGDSFSHDISYPWLLYTLTGFNAKEVRALTKSAVNWQKTEPVAEITWESPLAGLPVQKAGQVAVHWRNGLRMIPEMQELYAQLRAHGFEVWVCSASFIESVKEIASNPDNGYFQSENQVLAMQLEQDAQGRYLPIYKKNHVQTQQKGKTSNIAQFLAGPQGRYGYGPTLVAGDSDGDANMLMDFPDLKLGLIINRLKGKNKLLGQLAQEAIKTYKTPTAKYLLQGRDDNTGQFVPSQLHIALGKAEGKLTP